MALHSFFMFLYSNDNYAYCPPSFLDKESLSGCSGRMNKREEKYTGFNSFMTELPII